MATAYPDLANARAAVERLMVDTLVITRDAQGTEDDTLDLTTGLLTSPAPVTIYDGPGKFKTAQRQTNQVDEGGRYLTVTVYECAIPYRKLGTECSSPIQCVISPRSVSYLR